MSGKKGEAEDAVAVAEQWRERSRRSQVEARRVVDKMLCAKSMSKLHGETLRHPKVMAAFVAAHEVIIRWHESKSTRPGTYVLNPVFEPYLAELIAIALLTADGFPIDEMNAAVTRAADYEYPETASDVLARYKDES